MKPIRKLLLGGAMGMTALAGGALGASFLGVAGADTSTTAAANSTAAAPQSPPDWSRGGHQANGKTETVLTGDDAAKATAAAEAAVPGATAQRVETDADGDAYEVHMTKADGSIVTVKLDSSFKVTQTVDGMA
jgi:uncharacterized membrane protein YkoI